MKEEYLKLLEHVSTVLTSAGYDQTFREEAGEEIPADEQEFYEVLNFVYDLLTRTEISKAVIVKTPEEMKEPGFEDEFTRVYGITADDAVDFSFALAIRKGQISFRKLLRTMINRAGFGENRITMKEICKETGQGYPNMSRYLNNQQTIFADNVEKAINFVLKK